MGFRLCQAAEFLPSEPLETKTRWSPKFATKALASPRRFRKKSSSCISPLKSRAAESAWHKLIRLCSGTMDRLISNQEKGRAPPSGCAGHWQRHVPRRWKKLPREPELSEYEKHEAVDHDRDACRAIVVGN